MKFFLSVKKLLVSLILIAGMFVIYDVYILSQWVELRLLDKFVIHVILKDNVDIETFINTIKNEVKTIKFKELTYFTKQQVYDEIKQKEEFRVMLEVLKENPFSDVLKIKLNNFVSEEFAHVVNVINENVFTKNIIYDYNLKSYLDRVTKFNFAFNKIVVVLLIVVVFVILVDLYNIVNIYLLVVNIAILTIIYIAGMLVNFKIMNFITGCNLIKIDVKNVAVYIAMYIIAVLQNTSIKKYES